MKAFHPFLKFSSVTLAAMCLLGAPTVQAQVSDDVVRIGVMADMTGPYSGNGGPGTTLMVRMAIEDFGGKVLGKPIELVVADDQNKPDVGINIARQWIENDKVDAIIGGSASSIALGIQTIMKEKKKPYLIAGTVASDLTGKACSPMMVQFGIDTYAMAKAGVQAMLKQNLKSFYFVAVDYAFGKALQDDATKFIEAGGGKVVGSVKFPLGTTDFSSYLMQAQASGAKAVVFLTAGADLTNALKQAAEFRLGRSGQSVSVFGITINSVVALGQDIAQGLQFTDPVYWDHNEETRAFAKRYMARSSGGALPTYLQTFGYTAMLHYLRAVQAAGTDAGPAVMAKMKATPVNDWTVKNAMIREDGQLMRPTYSVQVKAPTESRNKNDLYVVKGEIRPEQVYRPLSEGGCDFVKGK